MKKILLLILDGVGINHKEEGNAIKEANTPVIDNLMSNYPLSSLAASGEEIGLPKETSSTSEVSHYCIGTSRTMLMPYMQINKMIRNKKFFDNEMIIASINHAINNNSSLHLIGLISSANIHSSINHYFAVLAIAKAMKFNRVYLHFFTDGKEMKEQGSLKLLQGINNKLNKIETGTIGSLCGRYYAMDHNNNYDRIKKAYDQLVFGVGNNFSSVKACLEAHYKSNLTDEYINPSIIDINSTIKDNDSIMFMNYRENDIKELVEPFYNKNYKNFQIKNFNNIYITSLFKYNNNINYCYENKEVINSIGHYLSSLDFKQARITEDFKIKDITYYLDGEKDIKDNNYNIITIKNKNKEIDPKLNIASLTQELLNIMDEDYDFIVCNLPNIGVFSKSTNIQKLIDSIELVDFCTGKIIERAKDLFYEVVITSPYGAAESMIDSKSNPNYSNTNNCVPLIICNEEYNITNNGTLLDIAPTIIDMFDIKIPSEMNGKSLLIKEE
ncbi:MAG: 2,3-bisphosphoglycerate-independent phosphoglycerate mutase [Bacilli bacterium]